MIAELLRIQLAFSNCPYGTSPNAPQESFFGHMKEEIDISMCTTSGDIEQVIANWTHYYNNKRYQWDLAKLTPVEYYQYLITGAYPLNIPKPNGAL